MNFNLFANVCLMLGQRRRRWPNIKQTLGGFIVIVGVQLSQLLQSGPLNGHFSKMGPLKNYDNINVDIWHAKCCICHSN